MRRTSALLALLILAGCGGAVRVEPPQPQGGAGAACESPAGGVPQTLGGAPPGESTPASPYVTVWGEAEIALRCGVPRPARMAPTDTLQEIDGVGWFAAPDKPTLYTAIEDPAYV